MGHNGTTLALMSHNGITGQSGGVGGLLHSPARSRGTRSAPRTLTFVASCPDRLWPICQRSDNRQVITPRLARNGQNGQNRCQYHGRPLLTHAAPDTRGTRHSSCLTHVPGRLDVTSLHIHDMRCDITYMTRDAERLTLRILSGDTFRVDLLDIRSLLPCQICPCGAESA